MLGYLIGLVLPEFSLSGIASFITANLMIWGGVVPYVPQYLEIKRSGNADGFSIFVCFTLLVANVFRILFWFGHPFELPLLMQSVVMIIAMFVMVHICTRVRHAAEILPAKPHHFTDFDSAYFWNWTDFESYFQCIGFISLVTAFTTMALLTSSLYIETLGFLAVFFEAMLGAPQFYRNYKNKSTQGMSLMMVLCWLSGDLFKTIYFVMRRAPTQFWVCGSLQITLDILIISQVFLYGARRVLPPRVHTKAAIQ